jgi:hypothetical protein
MDLKFFFFAFTFPTIAIALLIYIVLRYKQNIRPLVYILVIFVSLNIIHFKFGIFSSPTAMIWLFVINTEALIIYIFALLGLRKLKKMAQ